MEMQKNKVKEKLLRGECSVGVWHEIGHPDIAEMQAMTGWEFMVYEMEHAPISLESVQNCIQVADRYGTVPIVRVPANDPVHFKMCLDIGAQGLIVPMVNTAAEAKQAVRSTRYPPAGIRGYGPRRGAMYGSFEDDYYARFADENLLLFVQIETLEALDNLDEIASVEGLSGLFVGPNDLSISMGIRGQFDNPEFKAAIQRVLDTCKQKDLIPATTGGSLKNLKARAELGFRFLVHTSDTDIFIDATREIFNAVKELAL